MRGIRWLLPAAMLFIIVAVGTIYQDRLKTLAKNAPDLPSLLESALEGRATDWCHVESEGDRTKVRVCAASFRQVREPALMELEGVSIELYHPDGEHFDLVRSESAQFDIEARKLYSDGEVEIILDVSQNAPENARLLRIVSSGVEFNSDTGRAATARPVNFEFEHGGGSAVGATYDPELRELRLDNEVKLDWMAQEPASAPMHIESGQAWYIEHESKVLLYPWSRLVRETLTDTLTLDGGISEIVLEGSVIRRAEVAEATGVQNADGRNLEFGAQHLTLNFNDSMQMDSIAAQEQARLISTTAASRTTVTAGRLDLDLDASAGGTLENALATGGSRVEAAPIGPRGQQTPDTRTLSSEVIRLAMRQGGEEIDRVETDGPGRLEFTPNSPGGAARSVDGDRIWIEYGDQNRIRQFRTTGAVTETQQPGRPALHTQSQELIAWFDPATGIMTRMEQNQDFRYEQGDTKAQSDRATLEQGGGLILLEGSVEYTEGQREARAAKATVEQTRNVVTLEGSTGSATPATSAQMKDPSGSVAASRIEIDRKTGDYMARGNVRTTRQPDPDAQSGGMLSGNEQLQVVSREMTTSDGNQKILFTGDAKAWQGANRVEADRIHFDRPRQMMEASGNVLSQFSDHAESGSTKSAAGGGVFTVVRAGNLTYHQVQQLADYQGEVTMERPGLTVTGQQIQAFLADSATGTSLERAVAEGSVRIVSRMQEPGPRSSPARIRTGTADTAEYYAEEQKLVLSGGNPRLEDSKTGATQGKKLTLFTNSDRLLVDGEQDRPVESVIRTN